MPWVQVGPCGPPQPDSISSEEASPLADAWTTDEAKWQVLDCGHCCSIVQYSFGLNLILSFGINRFETKISPLLMNIFKYILSKANLNLTYIQYYHHYNILHTYSDNWLQVGLVQCSLLPKARRKPRTLLFHWRWGTSYQSQVWSAIGLVYTQIHSIRLKLSFAQLYAV